VRILNAVRIGLGFGGYSHRKFAAGLLMRFGEWTSNPHLWARAVYLAHRIDPTLPYNQRNYYGVSNPHITQ
jgi:hypothetical protein